MAKRHNPLPLTITDWDALWPNEHVFQAVAFELVRSWAGTNCMLIDTSQICQYGYWYRSSTGVSDITACVNGRFVEIELKSAYGVQSKQQKREQERVEKAGGTYVLAYTMRDVFNALELEIPCDTPSC
ncbi:MAG: hypothetical protein F4X12_08480 [Acidobacteriia bacterium]|nr:hypothetical protein [Terriglobia bacterium]